MTPLSIRDFCEAVYCGMTAVDAFVPRADGSIAFTASITERGQTTARDVQFLRVEGLTRRGDRPEYESGDQLELSAVEVERETQGWRVWVNPWYMEEIEFRCQEIILDGQAVIGAGRWLQDDLPERRSV